MKNSNPLKKISVILPVLNEVENVEELLQRLVNSLSGFDARIFLIDDGSTDGTLQKIAEAQKSKPQILLLNRAKTKPGCMRGEALVYGLREAVKVFSADYFVELDGDLSHRPEEIIKGIELVDAGNDIALGSKYLPSSKIEGRPVSRNFISYGNSLLFKILLGFGISDYSNGFRVYNLKAANVILNSPIKYGSPIYLAEAIGLWKRAELRFAEFPIQYSGREKGKSKVILRDVVKGVLGALDVSFSYYFSK